MFYSIITQQPLAKELTYKYDGVLSIGQLVIVRVRNKKVFGIITKVDITINISIDKIKPIEHIPPFHLSACNIHFMNWVANYTLNPIGAIFKMMWPLNTALYEKYGDLEGPPTDQHSTQTIALNDEQLDAFETINASNHFQTFLLDGVTGSGKTEVYFKIIEENLAQNKSTLIMIPEISLTSQLINRFHIHFGCKPTVWHSALSPKKRYENYLNILKGHTKIVLGTRSSLFLPYKELKTIIIDEEHDASFKQSETTPYNARDCAVFLAKNLDIPIILASATPSLETYHNATSGKYQHCKLTKRHGNASLPEVKLIDLKKHAPPKNSHISKLLLDAVAENIDQGQQSLIFINRRGYAPLILCGDCGHRWVCDVCHVPMVYHQKINQLKCHFCNHTQPKPSKCSQCGSENVIKIGMGIEKIHQEITQNFPNARVLSVVSDEIHSQKKYDEVFSTIKNHEVDIIIGTQIMAKGHDFEKLTLIGVVDADMGLSGVDIRASEKSYQLLSQVIGRAGRGKHPGIVYIQTFNPEHPALQNIAQHNRDHFYETEIEMRAQFMMPPLTKISCIEISGTNGEHVQNYAKSMYLKAPQDDRVMILGPTPPPVATIAGVFRQRFILSYAKQYPIQKYIEIWLKDLPTASTIKLRIDIDAQNFH